MKTNLLYISPDFNYSCGVSKHVFISLMYLSNNLDYELFFVTNKGDSLDRLSALSKVKFFTISFEKDHRNIFKLIIDFIKLYSFCRKNKINIIHTHHRYPELLAVLISQFCKIKTITTAHSFVNGLTQISFRSQKIITVSKAVEEYLYKYYPHTKGKCQTLYNCVDDIFYQVDNIDPHQFKKSLGYKVDDRLVLFVGRAIKIKGVDVLINALQKVPFELKIKLLIVGPILDESFKSLLTEKNNYIKHIESQKDIRPYYMIADLVILPSREDPFPYIMLEAAAMNKPVIGSRTGGIAEFIDDGINGLLFESEKTDELAEKIIYLVNNPDIAAKYSKALYIKVTEQCSCENYFNKLISIYSELVKL